MQLAQKPHYLLPVRDGQPPACSLLIVPSLGFTENECTYSISPV